MSEVETVVLAVIVAVTATLFGALIYTSARAELRGKRICERVIDDPRQLAFFELDSTEPIFVKVRYADGSSETLDGARGVDAVRLFNRIKLAAPKVECFNSMPPPAVRRDRIY